MLEKILWSQKPLIVLLIMAAALEQVATTVIKIWNQHAATVARGRLWDQKSCHNFHLAPETICQTILTFVFVCPSVSGKMRDMQD